MTISNAARQAALRHRRALLGLRQVTVWAPDHAIADIIAAAELIVAAKGRGLELTIDRVTDRATGRQVSTRTRKE